MSTQPLPQGLSNDLGPAQFKSLSQFINATQCMNPGDDLPIPYDAIDRIDQRVKLFLGDLLLLGNSINGVTEGLHFLVGSPVVLRRLW